MLEVLVSSKEVFSRCASILKPEYFSGDLTRVVRFVLDYFEKYKNIPDIATIQSEYDIELNKQIITLDKIEYTCSEIEQHCRESDVVNGIGEILQDIEKGNLGGIVDRMRTAVNISLQRDLGWEIFEKDTFAERLAEALVTQKTESTGISALDTYLSGGAARQQLTLFTANSGIGKSIMLNNLGHNYSVSKFHTVYLSLELPREMVFVRTAAILSGHDVTKLGEVKDDVADIVESVRQKTTGSFIMQRIRGDANSNDIRSYLTQYELKYNRRPDVLIVDYLDKMTPNQGNGKLSLSEQDKFKAEQLAEVIYDYNVIGFSASQQNREAISNPSPQQNVIAGGMTKINTVDNVISLYMDTQMRIRGEMNAVFLKTRSSKHVGEVAKLHFNRDNLRICDPGSATNRGIFDVTSRKLNYINEASKNLPGLEHETEEINSDVSLDFNFPESEIKKTDSSLLKFMEALNDDWD